MVIALLVFSAPAAQAEIFHSYGCSAAIGGLSEHAVGHSSSEFDFYWHSIGLFGRHDFNPKWYADLAGDVGYMRWEANGDRRDDDALSFEGRVIIMRKLFRHLHIGAGGGLCFLDTSDSHPDLGDSGVYGLLTGKIRVPVSCKWGVDFEADHVSGVTDRDAGNNVLKARVYFRF
jgi:hypothetical protein